MFPTLKIKVAGLNPKEEYDIRLVYKVAKIRQVAIVYGMMFN